MRWERGRISCGCCFDSTEYYQIKRQRYFIPPAQLGEPSRAQTFVQLILLTLRFPANWFYGHAGFIVPERSKDKKKKRKEGEGGKKRRRKNNSDDEGELSPLVFVVRV